MKTLPPFVSQCAWLSCTDAAGAQAWWARVENVPAACCSESMVLTTVGHLWRQGQALLCTHWDPQASEPAEWQAGWAEDAAVSFDLALRWAVDVASRAQSVSEAPPPSPGIAAAAIVNRVRAFHFVSGAPEGSKSLLEQDPEALSAPSLDFPTALLRLEATHRHLLDAAFPAGRPTTVLPLSAAQVESLLVALAGVLAAASA